MLVIGTLVDRPAVRQNCCSIVVRASFPGPALSLSFVSGMEMGPVAVTKAHVASRTSAADGLVLKEKGDARYAVDVSGHLYTRTSERSETGDDRYPRLVLTTRVTRSEMAIHFVQTQQYCGIVYGDGQLSTLSRREYPRNRAVTTG